MKTIVNVVFGTYKLQRGAQSVLGPAGCGPDVAEVDEESPLKGIDITVTLEETDPRLPVLFEILKKRNKNWLENHEDVYTEEELDGAQLLLIDPNPQAEVCGGVEYGMIYDLSGTCPACGTSAKQTSAVFIDAEDLKKIKGQRAGTTIFSHILVDPGLEAELVRTCATGISFRDVYAIWRDKRKVKLPWKQLCAARTLPPMSPSTTGLVREEPCEVCWRNGYAGTSKEPTRIVYRASDLRDADDVNLSWENRGYAILKPKLKDSLLSYPWMVVTPKVRRVFTDAGVTCFDWIPIRVEEG